MADTSFLLPVHNDLVVDLFSGGGGASTGIEQAIGRPVDISVNHDPEAVALHTVNHPQTQHYTSDVFEYPHGKGFRRAEVVGAVVPRYKCLGGYEVSVTPLLAKGGKGTDVVLETYRLYGARKVQE